MVQIVLLVTLFVLEFADVYSTRKILLAGGTELNWWVRWAIKKFGILPGLACVKLPPLIALCILSALGWLPTVILVGLCALYLYVVHHNRVGLTSAGYCVLGCLIFWCAVIKWLCF